MHEVRTGQDGPTVLLRFDLNQFPDNPPPKWRARGGNTVQVNLICTDVHKFELHGWTTDNIGELGARRIGSLIDVQFVGDSCQIDAKFGHLQFGDITAYHDDAR